MIFPVLGQAQYTNDFGAPRAQGSHQGIDIMAPRKALAVAVETGTVKFHTTSWAAGCMLYLYGKSGTTYLYIHLNNDRGRSNDNKGKCAPGIAFAPGLKSGAKVQAGEPVGYVGDSGDADGVAPHLHFEMHPRNGAAANPFTQLNRASRLLFAVKAGKTFTLALTGQFVASSTGGLQLKVATLKAYPGGLVVSKVGRTLTLGIPSYAIVEKAATVLAAGLATTLSSARKGQALTVYTAPAKASLEAQLGKSGSLAAARVVLGKTP